MIPKRIPALKTNLPTGATLILVVVFATVGTPSVAAFNAFRFEDMRLTIGGDRIGEERLYMKGEAALSGGEYTNSLELDITLIAQGTPVYKSVIPPGSMSTNDGTRFTLSPTGREQTGLEKLEITKTVEGISITLQDTRASLADIDYSDCFVCISIPVTATDSCGNASLVQTGSTWQLNG